MIQLLLLFVVVVVDGNVVALNCLLFGCLFTCDDSVVCYI